MERPSNEVVWSGIVMKVPSSEEVHSNKEMNPSSVPFPERMSSSSLAIGLGERDSMKA